jgi:hypothetical protein
MVQDLLSRAVELAIGKTSVAAVPQSPGSPGVAHATSGAADRADRQFDVFISYRRDKGAEVARLLAEKLQSRGYRVFLDVDALGSGEWGKELKDRIDECPDFIAVVTDGYFVRCANPDDVVRREIAHALERKATVVPLLVGEGGIPQDLPPDIGGISAHNGVRYLHEYADQAVDKVCGFLRSTPLLGPERLGSGEVQPRVVLFCALLFMGLWRGAVVGEDLMYTWWIAAGFALAMGLAVDVFVVLPVMVALTAYGNRKNIRRDLLYAGPWAPFWAILVPLMFVITSTFVFIVQRAVWGRSFFLGGLLGSLIAFPMTRIIVESNIWTLVAKSVGLRAR